MKKIDEKKIEDFTEPIIKAKRVFVVGAGREGLSSQAFAMRLMHLGKEVHWVWDDTTPNVEKGDLLIANSGSGEVISVSNVAHLAKELLSMRNVVLTPHIGSTTKETWDKMAIMVAEDCIAVLKGERPPHLVNTEILESNQKEKKSAVVQFRTP